MSREIRILSLDGGGIRGVFSAAALAYLEGELGRLTDHVDLVTGTSTGAIIALALGRGLSASEILASYKQAGRHVFAKPASMVKRAFAPGHDNKALREWLTAIFGDATLSQSRVPLTIPTYDASTGEPRVWKSDHHSDLHGGGSLRMVDVALASSAAPTYLPAVQVEGRGSYLDGGLWANNPSLVAVTEALRYLQSSIDRVRLVSIGTGRSPAWYKHREIVRRGALRWGLEIVDTVLEAQSQAVHNQVGLMIGEDRYVRVNVVLEREIALDDAREIEFLEHLGRTEGQKCLRRVRAVWQANTKREENGGARV